MKVKKVGLLLLALMMVISTLVGCGTKKVDEAKEKDVVQDISISMWEVDEDFVNKEDAVYMKIQDKFGINIAPVTITWDDYRDKTNLWAATGELPDVFSIDAVGAERNKWVEEEIIKPLPDDLSAYPNLEKLITLADVQSTKINDKVWFIPRAKEDISENEWSLSRGIIVRKDLMEEMGAKMPTNYEELKALAQQFKDNYPDMVPMTTFDIGFIHDFLSLANGITISGDWIDDGTGKFIPAYLDKKSKEASMQVADLYKKGLLDPDIIINTSEDAVNKFTSGNAAMLFIEVGAPQVMQNQGRTMEKNFPDKKIEDMIAFIPYLSNPYDDNIYHFKTTSFWSEAYINAKVSDEKMKKILELADWMLGKEYWALKNYGIEGTDYKMEGDKYVTIREKGEDGLVEPIANKYTFLSGYKSLFQWAEHPIYFFADDIPLAISEASQELYDWCAANTVSYPVNYEANIVITPARTAFVNNWSDDMKRILASEDPEKEYDQTMETYKSNGLDTVIQEVNDAIK